LPIAEVERLIDALGDIVAADVAMREGRRGLT
jgi:hypothetical protein